MTCENKAHQGKAILFPAVVSVAPASLLQGFEGRGLELHMVFTNCWLPLTWCALIAEGPVVDFGQM